MSKRDEHFFNVISVVIGILAAITIGIFVYAYTLGGPAEQAHSAADPVYLKGVIERITPVGRVAVAGKDNASLAIAAPAGAAAAAPAAAALPTNGEETYKAVCSVCHAAGVAGAPKAGDKAAWAPRVAQGKDTLYKHAVEGFQGKAGVMPAKGGRADLPDDLVRQAVDYLSSQ